MRLWNGLKLRDYVTYHEKVYMVTKLYEENGNKFCDLLLLNTKQEINGISIYDCTKVID